MKTLKTIIIALSVALISVPALADEGMWLLPLLEKMNIKTMQQMGCELSASDIYNINHSSLKDAVVHFGGGCTGEVVSSKGLLLTNHHCGYSVIQSLSTVEHDYLTDGYWAMDYSQELPAPGLTVTFMQSMTDVTKQLEKAARKAKDDHQRDSLMSVAAQQMISAATGDNKFLTATVSALYGGNYYYLIVYKTYRDVRFVGAPPSSIGKFGADTDNWMWPRHTCDFSMFRIYSDKDGNPAEYSEDNVPYNPVTHLTVSTKGIQEGDFSMIMGYPGSTNRYLTGPEIGMVRAGNEAGIYCRGHRQEVLMEDMLADPEVRLKYASKYSSSSNYWKNWIGMNEQIANLNVEERRYENDNAFRNWIAAKPGRNKKYAGVLDEIYSLVDKMTQHDVNLTYLTESIGRVELGTVANNVANRLRNYDTADEAARKEMLEGVNTYMDSFYKNYNLPTDVKVTKEMLKVAKEKLPAELLPEYFEVIDSEFAGDIDAFVDDLFATTAFSSKEKAATDIAAKAKAGRISFVDDPAYMFVQDYRTVGLAEQMAYTELAEKLSAARKLYIAGQLEMNSGKPIYPDANSTMRLTYGTVKSYEPKDGVIYKYYTTVKGVMEKEDPDNWEFVVPQKLKDLYYAGDFGRYANPDGSMPNCFIMTGDITGGNSGSPVFNGKGQLTGLAFDGNWEAMSGDIIFEPDLQRCICVDIRYVLFIIDKFGGAGYLVDEMTLD
jgi:hypothetical protein